MIAFIIILIVMILLGIVRIYYIGKVFINLINSDRYKTSKYEIQKIDNFFYALKNKRSGLYVDLCHPFFEWGITTQYGNDCKGSKNNVINAFNDNCPIIEPIIINKIF